MKIIKYLLTVLVVLLPISVVNAGAADNNNKLAQAEDLNVMCIYNDGISISKGYDDVANTVYASIKTFPVRNTKQLEVNVTKQKILGCSDANCLNISGYKINVADELSYKCPDLMYRWLVDEYDDYLKEKELVLYYYHNKWINSSLPVEKKLLENNKWYKPPSIENTILDIDGKNDKVQAIDLVSEQIEYRNGVTTNDSCTYAYKSKQGTNKYITVYGYSARLYLDNGEFMTTLNEDITINNTKLIDSVNSNTCKQNAPKICVKTSDQSLNSNNEYEFTQRRHEVANPTSSGCAQGYVLYEFTNYGSNGGTTTESLQQICDKIPHTAEVLTKVLSYIQIIVPALVIVYSGIDIGKIVLAGNVEEELPKRRKSLIIRFIIMLAFFFIPVIIKVIMGNIYGVDVGAIDCLYPEDTQEDNMENDAGENEGNGGTTGGSTGSTPGGSTGTPGGNPGGLPSGGQPSLKQ